MVPGAGLEPAHSYERGILNPLCLPISPPGQRVLTTLRKCSGGGTRSRTEIHGFAIRCIAILPFRQIKLLLIPEFGAGNEIRTRDPNLGKVVLYH